MNELVISNPKDLLGYLRKSESAIQMALPKHLNSDRMLRLALTCFSTTPGLRQCTAQSILGSIVVASQLGLEPGIAGQGYLIPYKTTCTFIPGWQGLVGLLNNTGRATAWTGAVFEGDEWDFQLGSQPRCKHVPGPNYGDEAKLTWVYACGQVNGSQQPVVEAWPMSRVWRHRDKYNRVGQRHYSYQNEEMYARKVVLMQVLKYMPRSIELNNALVAAEAESHGTTVTVKDGVVVEVEPAQVQQEEPITIAPAAAEVKPMGLYDHGVLPVGPEPETVEQQKRKRRTKAEMEAARAAEEYANNPVLVTGVKPSPSSIEQNGPSETPVAVPASLDVKPYASALSAIMANLKAAGVTEEQLVEWCVERSMLGDFEKDLMRLPAIATQQICTQWHTVIQEIKGVPVPVAYPQTPLTTHERFQAFMDAHQFTIDHLIKWATTDGAGNIPNIADVETLADVSEKDLARLLNAQTGLMRGIKLANDLIRP